jgi:hypothetical protein
MTLLAQGTARHLGSHGNRVTRLWSTFGSSLVSISRTLHQKDAESRIRWTGALFSGASLAFGMLPMVTETVLFSTIAVTEMISRFGRNSGISDLRLPWVPHIDFPPSIYIRQRTIEYVCQHFNGGYLAWRKPHESNQFWTPMLCAEVMNAAFEQKNPFSGFAVRDEQGRVFGLFGAWAIRPDRLVSMLNGTIPLNDIRPNDILPYSKTLDQFYVDILLPRTTPQGVRGSSDRDQRIIRASLQGAGVLFERAYRAALKAPNGITLYALEKTRDKCGLLKDLGFERDDALSSTRRDGRYVFRKTLNAAEIMRLRVEWRIVDSDVDIHIHANLQRRGAPLYPT